MKNERYIVAICYAEDTALAKEQVEKQTIKVDDAIFMTDSTPAIGIEARRERIAELQVMAQWKIDRKLFTDDLKPEDVVVWQIEGDSVIPEDALERLLKHYDTNDEAVYSGVQIGRHGLYCIGAWHINQDETVIESVDHNKHGLVEVDGMGLYCYIMRADLFIKAESYWSGQKLGPDVNWFRSLDVPKYVDMDLHIGHYYKGGIIEVDSLATCNARFTKVKDEWIFEQLD